MAIPFDETAIFPTNISYGSTGGPWLFGEIATNALGFEEANSPWSMPRHQYDVSYGIKDIDQLHTVKIFFLARHGVIYGFRYKDWADYKSGAPLQAVTDTDQLIGVGDAAEVDFQLIKNYISAGRTLVRNIQKPITGTVVISLDDVPQGSGWTVDTTTGVVTFTAAPGGSVNIKAGYEFHVPVRFVDDKLLTNLSHFERGQIPALPLIERRIALAA